MASLLNLFTPLRGEEEGSPRQNESSHDNSGEKEMRPYPPLSSDDEHTEHVTETSTDEQSQSTETSFVDDNFESTIPYRRARIFSRPDVLSDPGGRFLRVEEEDGTPSKKPRNLNKSDSTVEKLRNIFRAPSDDESDDTPRKSPDHDQEDASDDSENSWLDEHDDDLAREMRREVEERKIMQRQKIEESAFQNARRRKRRPLIQSNNILRRIWMRLQHKARQQPNILFFLALLGLLTGLVGFAMEMMIKLLELAHKELTYTTDIWPVQFLLWTVFLYIGVAIAVVAVRYISLSAMGSGIPEMKSILSGVTLVEYLSFRTLLAKVIGLTFAIGSSMVVGKEGPFVHTASIIANQLFALPFFQVIRRSGPLRQKIFTCAIAAGVSGNFGAPIGGLLFSIEVTSTYYPVRNYFYSAWAAMFSGFTFRFLWNIRFGQPLFSAIAATNFTKEAEGIVGLSDVLASVFMGIIGGLVGVCFIFLHLNIIKLRRKGAEYTRFFKSPYPYTFLIATLTAVLLFPELIGDYMALLPIASLKNLSVSGSLANASAQDWLAINVWVSVPLFLLSRFWLTGLSISLPIPCGLFVPVITVGAGIGRLFGEVLAQVLGEGLEPSGELPGIMAVVGAAAVGAGVTQTFSVAVLMFELTGQIVLLVPVTITVVVAMAVSRQLSYNVYDGILKSRNLPYLPDIRTRGHSIRAVDIMETSVISEHWYLTRKTTYRSLLSVLKSTQHLTHLAVVDSEEKLLLLGIVSRTTLDELLSDFRQRVLETMGPEENNEPHPQNQKTWHAEMTHHAMRSVKSALTHNKNEPRRRQGVLPTDDPDDDELSQTYQSLLDQTLTIPYEYSPVQFQPSTPLTSIHLLFITLRLRNAYVTINGRLTGVITRADIKTLIDDESFFEWLAN